MTFKISSQPHELTQLANLVELDPDDKEKLKAINILIKEGESTIQSHVIPYILKTHISKVFKFTHHTDGASLLKICLRPELQAAWRAKLTPLKYYESTDPKYTDFEKYRATWALHHYYQYRTAKKSSHPAALALLEVGEAGGLTITRPAPTLQPVEPHSIKSA